MKGKQQPNEGGVKVSDLTAAIAGLEEIESYTLHDGDDMGDKEQYRTARDLLGRLVAEFKAGPKAPLPPTVHVVVWYEWQSWKSFRSLQARTFATEELAENFKTRHRHANNENWYFEVFEQTVDTTAANSDDQ